MSTAHYYVPNIAEINAEIVNAIELITLVVGSDLVLSLRKNLKEFSHGVGGTAYWNVPEFRVEAHDSDGNYLATLAIHRAPGLLGLEFLALCVPIAERLFPTYLTTEQ